MRFDAGRYESETSCGVVLHTAEPMSRQQADVLLRVIRDAGLEPEQVTAIEFTECGWTVHPI